MAGLNKVMLIGRLGKDPEVSGEGDKMRCRFSVATDETWKDKSGQKQKKTEWHNVIAWGKLADLCGQYLAKGKQVFIEGKAATRKYQKDGRDVYAHEVVAQNVTFLGGPGDGGGRGRDDEERPTGGMDGAADEDIPF